jgi:hypothetical protein
MPPNNIDIVILILNQTWFANELRQAGYKVLTCGIGDQFDVPLPSIYLSITEILMYLPADFQPHVILYLDNGAPLTIRKLTQSPCVNLFYSVDTHHMAFAQQELVHIFEHIFVAQKDYLHLFDQEKSSWLPVWASKSVNGKHYQHRNKSAIFVGTLNPELNPQRVTFIQDISKLCPLLIKQGNFELYFPEMQIALNQTVSGDLNFRVFEAMGSGCLLMTEDSTNGLKVLFTPQEHLITYPKGETAVVAQLINYYLNNTAIAAEIAQRGHKEIIEKHLAQNRAQAILDTLEMISSHDLPNKIKDRQNHHPGKQAELFQLLIATLSFFYLDRPSQFEALDHSLTYLKWYLSTIATTTPLPIKTFRLAYLTTFITDALIPGTNIGQRFRNDLAGHANQHQSLHQSNQEHINVSPNLLDIKHLVGMELKKLHDSNLASY